MPDIPGEDAPLLGGVPSPCHAPYPVLSDIGERPSIPAGASLSNMSDPRHGTENDICGQTVDCDNSAPQSFNTITDHTLYSSRNNNSYNHCSISDINNTVDGKINNNISYGAEAAIVDFPSRVSRPLQNISNNDFQLEISRPTSTAVVTEVSVGSEQNRSHSMNCSSTQITCHSYGSRLSSDSVTDASDRQPRHTRRSSSTTSYVDNDEVPRPSLSAPHAGDCVDESCGSAGASGGNQGDGSLMAQDQSSKVTFRIEGDEAEDDNVSR